MNAYEEAHRHSTRHRVEIEASAVCGCFYCGAIFAPDRITDRITEWIQERRGGQTALCPHCGIDSVLGSASGFPITPEFLAPMRERWFGKNNKTL